MGLAVVAGDVVRLWQTSPERIDISVGPGGFAAASASALLVTVVGALWWSGVAHDWLRRRALPEKAIAFVAAGGIAVAAVSLASAAAARHDSTDGLAIHSCGSASTVAVIDDPDVRDAAGPDLRRSAVGVGSGSQGDLDVIDDPAQFTALHPDALVIGDIPTGESPPAWTVPATWTRVGEVPGGILYLRHACSADDGS